MNSQPNILPPNAMQPNLTAAIDLTFDDHTVSSAEMRSNEPLISLVDSVLHTDSLTKQITNKGLSDTIHVNEWFTIKSSPQSDPWS